MRKVLILLVALLFPSALWASGNSYKGQVPPELNARQWANTQPLNWQNLKGKVVLLEFFSMG